MRRFLAGAALLALTISLTVCNYDRVGAEEKPDSPGAKATREKKLTTKVKAEFDNVMLRAILEEFPQLVNDAGGGRLRVKIDPKAGITLTSRFTIKGEMTVHDVLEAIVKDRPWGWYVNSTKVGDQDDGAIIISGNNKEHGFREGTGPVATKTKEDPKTKKEDPKKEDPKKEDPKTPDGEKAASELLSKAKLQIAVKKFDDAKKTLNEIITKYPTTKAATTAKKELENLGK